MRSTISVPFDINYLSRRNLYHHLRLRLKHPKLGLHEFNQPSVSLPRRDGVHKEKATFPMGKVAFGDSRLSWGPLRCFAAFKLSGNYRLAAFAALNAVIPAARELLCRGQNAVECGHLRLVLGVQFILEGVEEAYEAS